MAKSNMKHKVKNHYAAGSFLLVAVCLLTGLTVSWFMQSRVMGTVSEVDEPSEIFLIKTDNSELTEINLESSASKSATRNIRIASRSPHFYLELSYTTNIEGLTVVLKRDGSAVNGDFLNRDVAETNLANTGDDYYRGTYETDETVQKNAVPLYWRSAEQETNTITELSDGNYYYQDYVLEAAWTETDKETDLIYIMAANDLDSGV